MDESITTPWVNYMGSFIGMVFLYILLHLIEIHEHSQGIGFDDVVGATEKAQLTLYQGALWKRL
ncbi:MAG TPA: hypothetical protein VMC62_06080 [Longilinea sp.]|nr:hypothetical protein [Longilinea sp.]